MTPRVGHAPSKTPTPAVGSLKPWSTWSPNRAMRPPAQPRSDYAPVSAERWCTRYGTKDALLDELMHTEYEQRILGGVDDASTGLERVQAFVDHLGQLATDDERLLKAMFILSFEAVRGSAGVTPRITRWLTDLEAGIVAALTAGKNDGSVRADLEPASAAREAMIEGFGIAYAWIVLPGTDFHAELARWRARIAADYSPPA